MPIKIGVPAAAEAEFSESLQPVLPEVVKVHCQI